MPTISNTFTAVGDSSVMLVKPGRSVTYAATASSFVGIAYFQRSRTGGASWETLETATDASMTGGTYKNETAGDEWFRFHVVQNGESAVSGSLATSMALDALVLAESRTADGLNTLLFRLTEDGVTNMKLAGVPTTSAGVGAKNGATVSVAEQGEGLVHQTTLTLASTVVNVANTTGASFGGTKLYDFPAGRILLLGLTADLSVDWSATSIAATGSGDVSMGSTITADATLDSTDVDMLPSTGLTDPFVAGVGAAAGALAASAQFDGTTTPADLNINMIIDDADVADAADDDVLVSGTVTVTWINLGDY